MVAARGAHPHTGTMRMMSLLLLATMPGFARAAPPDTQLCGVAITAAERQAGTPPGLLAAIGVVESGRRDPRTGQRTPWPWTVTAEGVGSYYPTKAAAVAAVEALQARGVANIDTGCMQVNLLHHPQAFRTLDDAFDPATNTRYAARFLNSLYARTGAWPAAAAAYHSFTPELGARYGRLIAAVWGGAPVPVAPGPNGTEVVTFGDGGQLRIFRGGAVGLPNGRVAGFLSGP